MVKNYSSSQKTVKGFLFASQSDSWSLDRVLLYADYADLSLIPIGTIIDDYYDYFETLLEEVEVPEEYFYSPAGFSEYYYGDPGLDFLVMRFSGIPSLFEFNKKKIKVFPLQYLKEFNKLATFKKEEVQSNRQNPPRYEKFVDIINQEQAYEDYFQPDIL